MGRKMKRQGRCAYCGTIAQLTEDHVIPRALFPEPMPPDIPKVGACANCNNKIKAFGDAYLRDLVLADMTTFNHPDAKKQWDKFVRSLGRRQSALAREIVWNGSVQVFTPGGVFVGTAIEAKIPLDRITTIMKMLVRGLYQAYTGLTLPADVQFDVKRYYDDTEVKQIIEPLLTAGALHFQAIGDGKVFACVYGYVTSNPAISMWVLVFYERAVFVVITGPVTGTNAAEEGTSGETAN